MLDCDSVIEKTIAEIGELCTRKKIVIYGTGKYGRMLYECLQTMGIEDSVLGFTVTVNTKSIDALYGKKITEYKELVSSAIKPTLVLAVGCKSSGEIMQNINLDSANCRKVYKIAPSFPAEAREIFLGSCSNELQGNKVFIYSHTVGYGCNGKYIVEELKRKKCPVDIVWAVRNDGETGGIPKEIKVVVQGTKEYYEEYSTSKIWVTNSLVEEGLNKRKGQFWINTWHGYGPFKTVGISEKNSRQGTNHYKCYKDFDLFITASTFYSAVYRESFGYSGEIMESGAPRNDVFFSDSSIKTKIYNFFDISKDKKILLYAPTYRYDKESAFNNYNMQIKRVLEALKKRFGGEYACLYRFHLVHNNMKHDYFSDGIDVTTYPDVQELLVAADVVITDYSSLMWDFSLQRKPVFLFQNDEEQYTNNRGFYAPIQEWPYPKAHTQAELEYIIETFDEKKYLDDLEIFLNKYGTCDDGYASERVVKRILQEMDFESGNRGVAQDD